MDKPKDASQNLEKTPLEGTQGGKNNFHEKNPRNVPMPGNSGGKPKGGSGVPDMTKGDGQAKNDDEYVENETPPLKKK